MRILECPTVETMCVGIVPVLRDCRTSRVRTDDEKHQRLLEEATGNTYELHSSRARYNKIVLDMQTMNFVLRDAGASPTDRG